MVIITKLQIKALLQSFEEEISGMLLIFSNANFVLGGDSKTMLLFWIVCLHDMYSITRLSL